MAKMAGNENHWGENTVRERVSRERQCEIGWAFVDEGFASPCYLTGFLIFSPSVRRFLPSWCWSEVLSCPNCPPP